MIKGVRGAIERLRERATPARQMMGIGLAVNQQNRDDVLLFDHITALEAAVRPFAKIAEPINGEAGRPSPLDVIERGGTGELFVSSHFGTRQAEEPLYADDFSNAAKALGGVT